MHASGRPSRPRLAPYVLMAAIAAAPQAGATSNLRIWQSPPDSAPPLAQVFATVPCTTAADFTICDEAAGTVTDIADPPVSLQRDDAGRLVLYEYDSDVGSPGTDDHLLLARDPLSSSAVVLTLPPGAPARLHPLATSCPPDCGTNAPNAAMILGSVADAQVTLEPDDLSMAIHVPIALFAGACTGRNFSLMQVEVDVTDDATGGMSGLVLTGAELQAGVVGGPVALPAMPDYDGLINADPGTRRLRWFDAFGGIYPTIDVVSTDLVVKLTFDQPLCNVRLTAFNFRVPYEPSPGVVRELLCGRVDDPQNPAAYPVDPGILGEGRGPEALPSETCACVPACVNASGTGRCPFNDIDDNGGMNTAADRNVMTALLPIGVDINRRVQVIYTNTCNCNVDVSYVEFTFLNCCGRTCNTGSPLPKLVAYRWKPLGVPVLPPVTLPAPVKTEVGACTRNYKWGTPTPLTGMQARPGETVQLELDFDGDMASTNFSVLTLRIGGTYPNDAAGQDPACSPSEPAPSPGRLPLAIPQPVP